MVLYAKQFLSSRTFWTLIGQLIGNVVLLLAALGRLPFDLTPEVMALAVASWNIVLGILAGFFRWVADGPLAVRSGTVVTK